MSVLNKEKRDNLKDSDFGLPDIRRFPLNDENHVRSAITMFNNCPNNRKKELAGRILRKCKLYGIKINKESKIYDYINYKKDESFNFNLYKEDNEINLDDEYLNEETENVKNDLMASDKNSIYSAIPVEYFEINKILDMYTYDKIFIDTDIHLFKYNELTDKKILECQKEVVSNDDVYINLGDLSQDTMSDKNKLMNYLIQFNGKYKILVLGNNDVFSKDFYLNECGFDFVVEAFTYNKFVFSHAPISKKYTMDKINIHGHLHNRNNYYNYSYNGNICLYNRASHYKPLSLENILKKYEEGFYNPKKNNLFKEQVILMSEVVQFSSDKKKIIYYTNNYEDIMDKFTVSNQLIRMSMKINKSTKVVKKELCNLYMLHLLTKKAIKENKNKIQMTKANAFIMEAFSTGLKYVMHKENDFNFNEYFKKSEQYPYAIKIDLELISDLTNVIKNILLGKF